MSRLALVVDDSMLIRHMVCRFLEDRGFTVESATNGVEALELLLLVRPDVVITDLTMSRMDGAEFVEKMHQKPDLAGIPVIVLAAKSSAMELSRRPAAEFVIFKDIDIRGQLDRALKATFAV